MLILVGNGFYEISSFAPLLMAQPDFLLYASPSVASYMYQPFDLAKAANDDFSLTPAIKDGFQPALPPANDDNSTIRSVAKKKIKTAFKMAAHLTTSAVAACAVNALSLTRVWGAASLFVKGSIYALAGSSVAGFAGIGLASLAAAGIFYIGDAVAREMLATAIKKAGATALSFLAKAAPGFRKVEQDIVAPQIAADIIPLLRPSVTVTSHLLSKKAA